jgi:integrase
MPKRPHDGITKRCECPKKRWPKCSHPWWFGFRYKDRQYRFSLDRIASAREQPVPTSKSDAIKWRDRLRNEIRSGEFSEAPAAAQPDTRLTFADVCDKYLKGHVQTPTRRPGGRKMMEILVALARRAEIPAAHGSTVKLEDKPIDEITKADIEAVRACRREQLASGKGRPGAKSGEAGINRLLSRIRHVFNWAIAEGYLADTPFKRGSVSVVKLETSVEHARTRRLAADGVSEEERVRQHADPHLRAVLSAALSTGCRIGELLSLQWSQIRRDEKGEARWLELPATKTKTGEPRVIPVGTQLRAELSMRRHDLDGQKHPPTAYVFGNETGEQVKSVRRQWEDPVLKAHGHTPERIRGKLTAQSRATLRGIDLHVHDLRREFASRLLESSADFHDVQMFLGHAAITTTSRYLQSTPTRLLRALDRLEAAGCTHDAHTGQSEATETAPQPQSEIQSKSLN